MEPFLRQGLARVKPDDIFSAICSPGILLDPDGSPFAPTNALEVALGQDLNGDEDLEPEETEFDSMRYVSRIVEGAKGDILLIDPYSDAVTLEVLAKKRKDVKARLVCKDRGQPTVSGLIFGGNVPMSAIVGGRRIVV